MEAERYCKVNNHLVEEIYWAGKYPVYVDNRLTKYDYETCIDMINDDKLDELFEV